MSSAGITIDATDEAVREVLALGIEDFAGPWEIVEIFKTRSPEATGDENREAARLILHQLIRQGWCSLFRCQEHGGGCSALASDDATAVFESTECWNESTPTGFTFRFGTTDAGETALDDLES